VTVTALIEELIAAWSSGDALRASAFFAPEALYCEPNREPIHGRDAIFSYFLRFFRDGPPWKFFVDEIVARDDRAVVIYRFAIKGDGDEWRERAGCAAVTCVDGLITEWREYYG
jgi:uncharacterized protein (TIGR02246 family)